MDRSKGIYRLNLAAIATRVLAALGRPHSHGEDRAVSHPKQLRHLVGLALSLALMRTASPAWAWGDLGHKVICQIAFQELNDTARTEVVRLVATDTAFDSFPDACTWPDHP